MLITSNIEALPKEKILGKTELTHLGATRAKFMTSVGISDERTCDDLKGPENMCNGIRTELNQVGGNYKPRSEYVNI